MGDLDRAELREEVVANIGNRREFSADDTSTLEYQTLNRALDRGQKAITRAHPGTWRELRRSDVKIIVPTGVESKDLYFSDLPQYLHKWLGIVHQEGETIDTDTLLVSAAAGDETFGIAAGDSDFSAGTWISIVLDNGLTHTGIVQVATAVLVSIQGFPFPSAAAAGNAVTQITQTDRGFPLHGILRDQWKLLIGQSNTLPAGRVRYYVMDRDATGADRLMWFRNPDSPFTIYMQYTVFPKPFEDATTPEDATSELNDKDDIIIAYGTAYCFRRLQQFDEENRWFISYTNLLNEAIQDDMTRPDEWAVPLGYGYTSSRGAGNNPWQDPFRRDNHTYGPYT